MIITSVRCTAAESTAKNFKEQRYELPFIHFPPLIQFRIMRKLEYIPAARGRGSTVDTCHRQPFPLTGTPVGSFDPPLT